VRCPLLNLQRESAKESPGGDLWALSDVPVCWEAGGGQNKREVIASAVCVCVCFCVWSCLKLGNGCTDELFHRQEEGGWGPGNSKLLVYGRVCCSVFLKPQFRTSILFFHQKHISLWRVWFLLCYVYKGWQKVRKNSRHFFFLGVGFYVSLKLESGYKSWPS